MTMVLNELDFAERALENGVLGRHPSETLTRIAKYYINQLGEDGCTKEYLIRMLENFLIANDPYTPLGKWYSVLERCVKNAFKHKPIVIDDIPVTQPEIDKINLLESKQARRLAVTLLCLSKYWDAVNPLNNHWTHNEDTEIMKMANISASIRRQSAIYAELKNAGYIQFSKKIDNTNVRVLFREPGNTAMSVTDMRNIGYQYLMHCGESFLVCEHCGMVIKRKSDRVGRPQKYCKTCAANIKIQQNIESVMRYRGV